MNEINDYRSFEAIAVLVRKRIRLQRELNPGPSRYQIMGSIQSQLFERIWISDTMFKRLHFLCVAAVMDSLLRSNQERRRDFFRCHDNHHGVLGQSYARDTSPSHTSQRGKRTQYCAPACVKVVKQVVLMVSRRLKCCTLGKHSIVGHIPRMPEQIISNSVTFPFSNRRIAGAL